MTAGCSIWAPKTAKMSRKGPLDGHNKHTAKIDGAGV